MRYRLKDFLSVVFNPGESTCFSSDPKGTRIYPVNDPPPGSCFFSINPIHGAFDLAPSEPYHSTMKPRRADVNCTAYRTILCEFDQMSLDEQLAMIDHINFPATTLTYSGGKSIHALIILNEDLDRKAYDALVKRVYRALGTTVDIANKNPSRLSRLPEAIRDNGNTQDLIELRSRMSLSDLDQWLENRGAHTESAVPVQTSFPGFMETRLPSLRSSTDTMNFLMGSYEEGTWNIRLFKASCELFKRGHDYQQVVDQCSQITGHLDSKDIATIRSAQRTVSR